MDVSEWLVTHPELARIVLRECERCGLQFFEPQTPGDETFYSAIESTYVETRWEFDRALAYVGGASVADLGCGPGRFLRAIAPHAARVVGNDHSATTLSELEAHGVEVCAGPFTEMTRRYGPEFDVVTAFHLLEHVAAPRRLFEVALTILRPGGVLVVSVPNRDRIVRDRFEPLDWPPHHLTRWAPEQIRWLADLTGFDVETIEIEPTLASSRRAARLPAPLQLPAALGFALMRGARLNVRRPLRSTPWKHAGLALMAVLRLPERSP